MHKHLTFLSTIITLLCMGVVFFSSPAYAAYGDPDAGEGKTCCDAGYDVAYKKAGDSSNFVCCKSGSSQGTDKETCCEKAGGVVKNGKCCKCPSGDPNCV